MGNRAFRFQGLAAAVVPPGAIAVAVAMVLSGSSAVAQDAGADGRSQREVLQEILVTARRREERLYDAPLSITSFSAEDIANANLRDVTDLALVAPGFFYTPQVTFSSSRITPALRFRGVTIPRNDPLVQLAGVFVDGAYLFGGAQSLTFDDIERVEVIKGPQSTMFARSTFSGAINFITREPADELRARVSAGIETRDSRNLAGSLEGPLGSRAGFRVSAASNEKGAHFRATDGGELGRERTDVVNAQLVFRPMEDLRIRLRHSEVWLDDSRNATVNLNPQRPELAGAPGVCLTGTQPFFCGALPTVDQLSPGAASASTSLIPPAFARSNNPFVIIDVLNNNLDNPLVVNGLPYIDRTPKLDRAGLAGRFRRTSLEAEYGFANGLTASASVAGSRMASTSAQVSTDDNGNQYVVSTNILTDQSGDLRLASDPGRPFSWVAGVNVFSQRSVGGPSGTGGLIRVLDATNVVQYSEPAVFSGQGEVSAYSAYFGARYEFNERFALDLEGRYQSEDLTTSLGLSGETKSTFNDFVPRVILTFKPNEDITLYGSWARGSVRGTTNSNVPLLSPALQEIITAIPGYSFDVPTETLDSIEVGFKQVFERFRYAISAYYMDWSNLKNVVNTPCPGGQCGPGIPGAFAPAIIPSEADIRGLEAEFDALLSDRLSVSAQLAVARARYGELFFPLAFAATGSRDATGKTPVGFPGVQGALNATYTGNVRLFAGEDWEWFLRGETFYTGKIYVDEINQSWIDDRIRANLRAGVNRNGTRVELYVENLFNNKDWASAVRGSAANLRVGPTAVNQATAFAVLPRLRTIGIRASYEF